MSKISFDKVNIIVVGDIILDEYVLGNVDRISPEAPIPILKIQETKFKLGGAANVAMNLKSLGCNVLLLGLVGEDEPANIIESILIKNGIFYDLVNTAMPTIHKKRFVAQNHQMLRVDNEKKFTDQSSQELLQKFKQYISDYEACILSDYNKGTLSNPVDFIGAAKSANKYVFVDPKKDSLSQYSGCDLICPNSSELSRLCGIDVKNEPYIPKLQLLMQQHNIKYIAHTKSSDGMSLIHHTDDTYNLSAETISVFDVTGAGDTVIAVAAACKIAGYSWQMAMFYANKAAGIVVKKPGTASVLYSDVFSENIKTTYDQESEIKEILAAKANKEIIVMTNGCFDILHSGHIKYLREAKELGHKLVVAINSDSSVKAIKGSDRPINNENERMTILKSLMYVDYVLFFSELTPENLIRTIEPDILVKGGDYTEEQVVGADIVKSYGGKVKVLSHVPGKSTTNIVNKINQQDEAITY